MHKCRVGTYVCTPVCSKCVIERSKVLKSYLKKKVTQMNWWLQSSSRIWASDPCHTQGHCITAVTCVSNPVLSLEREQHLQSELQTHASAAAIRLEETLIFKVLLKHLPDNPWLLLSWQSVSVMMWSCSAILESSHTVHVNKVGKPFFVITQIRVAEIRVWVFFFLKAVAFVFMQLMLKCWWLQFMVVYRCGISSLYRPCMLQW